MPGDSYQATTASYHILLFIIHYESHEHYTECSKSLLTLEETEVDFFMLSD